MTRHKARLSGTKPCERISTNFRAFAEPVVRAASGGEAVDGAHQAGGIDPGRRSPLAIAVAGERVRQFFHHLRGLLKRARRAAGH